jgi:hypothetical protein
VIDQDTGRVQTEAPVAIIQVEVEREMEPEGDGVTTLVALHDAVDPPPLPVQLQV